MTMEQKDLSLTKSHEIKEKHVQVGAAINFQEKEVDLDCETHGKIKAKVFYLNGRWTKPSCKQCQEQKRVKEEALAEVRRKDAEVRAREARITSALGRSGIPTRFKNHSFETFKPESEDQKKKKQLCADYAKNFSRNFDLGTSMIFCGKTGTGKTHLACSIANDTIQQGRTAVFMSVIRAIRQIKDTWSRDSKVKEQEAIDWFKNPDLLILDEIGVQFGTEAEKLVLFEILNNRYEDMKPTILISNLEPGDLKDFVGDRVMDRMKENGGRILRFDWNSNRAT